MGMFDDFEVDKCVCPYCDSELANMQFQSKAWDCLLHTYVKGERLPTSDQEDTFEMHDICPNCDLYFHMEGLIEGGKYAGAKPGSESRAMWHNELKEDAKFFAANKAELAKQYKGENIFIYKNEVFHDKDYDTAVLALIKAHPDALISKESYPSFTEKGKTETHYKGKWLWHRF